MMWSLTTFLNVSVLAWQFLLQVDQIGGAALVARKLSISITVGIAKEPLIVG
jgi:hypothetical protein